MYKLFFILVFTLTVTACSSQGPGEQTDSAGKAAQKTSAAQSSQELQPDAEKSGKSYSLEIRPRFATRNMVLNAVPGGFRVNDVLIQWLVNDRVTEEGPTLNLNEINVQKGADVRARAMVQGREVRSSPVYIQNSPPEITRYRILPEVFQPGDTLHVEVEAADADGDRTTVLYEWLKNNRPAGTGSRIDASIKRGDVVIINMTPFDGESYGERVVRRREIQNLPPMIEDARMFMFDGKAYTHQVLASDPDGDRLTYSLVTLPEKQQISIDKSSGIITWDVSPEFTGEVPVTVSVTDGNGGEASQDLTLSIKPSQQKSSTQ